MKTLAKLTCVAAIAFLAACANTLPPRHVTLDDGRTRMPRPSRTPSVAIVQVNIPELIDRPQLVLRADGNQVTLSDQYRWAEPLRHEIPRVVATDLGEMLGSSGVVAPPADAEGFAPEFKLFLDFQQLEAVVGQGAKVDVLWRLEHSSGNASVGRSTFRQPMAADEGDYLALVAAQRQALLRVAAEMAKEIAVFQKCQREAEHGKYRTQINLALCTVLNSTGYR